MRLWSIHPSYLDSRGLVALWREALLAKKVLSNKTRGYKYHPQLIRFRKEKYPLSAINAYLEVVYNESKKRGYTFDRMKIRRVSYRNKIKITDGQIDYEFRHLKKKLHNRSRDKYFEICKIIKPKPHPLFKLTKGKKEDWEK